MNTHLFYVRSVVCIADTAPAGRASHMRHTDTSVDTAAVLPTSPPPDIRHIDAAPFVPLVAHGSIPSIMRE